MAGDAHHHNNGVVALIYIVNANATVPCNDHVTMHKLLKLHVTDQTCAHCHIELLLQNKKNKGCPGSGLPDQVSESIIRFPWVKPVAGLDQTAMESWGLTPSRTEIFCNPKELCHYRLRLWFCNNNSSIGPNRNSVCSFWNGFK